MWSRRSARAIAMATLACAATTLLQAAELQERTLKAYDAYFAEARRAFMDRTAGATMPLPAGSELRAGPARGDGIIDVPGGLVHHWSGAMHIRGLTLARAIEASQDYAGYPSVYASVVSAKLLERDGSRFHIQMRVKGSSGGVSAVLDIRSTVEFTTSSHRAWSIAVADEIREVTGSGSSERLLPAGRDSGYLWRAASLTMFTEVADGLILEMETIGLSRGFPPMLGWMIEPIARRLGRRSVETSLKEFAAAAARQTGSAARVDLAHDRLDVRPGTVHVREWRVGLVKQQRQVSPGQQDRIGALLSAQRLRHLDQAVAFDVGN